MNDVRIGKNKNNPEFEPFTFPEQCDKLWGLKVSILTGEIIRDDPNNSEAKQ